MAQVKFGNCHTETEARPHLQAAFSGVVTSMKRAACLPDPLLKKGAAFGSGPATINHSEVDMFDVPLPRPKSVEFARVATQAGEIVVPRNALYHQFVPSASELDFLTSGVADSRLNAPPTRYFR